MGDSPGVLATALDLLIHIDSDLVDIILLSLRVTLTAVAFAALLGIPLGALLAVSRFPGRGFLVLVFHTLMGLPRWSLASPCTCSCRVPDRSGYSISSIPPWP